MKNSVFFRRNRYISIAMASAFWRKNFLILITAFCWGSAFPFITLAIETIPSFTVVALRMLLASLLLYGYCRVRGMTLTFRRAYIVPCILLGLAGNVIPFVCIAVAQQTVSSSVSSLMLGLLPLYTVFLAHFFLRDEPLSWVNFSGCLLAFFGVAYFVYPDVIALDVSRWEALILLAFATFSLSVANILGKKFSAIPQATLATGMTFAATIIIVPFAFFYDGAWQPSHYSLMSVGSVVFLAVICTATATLLFFKTLAVGGTLAAGLANNLVLPIAVGLSAVMLGEELTLRMGVATLLIIAGTLTTQGEVRAWVGKRFVF